MITNTLYPENQPYLEQMLQVSELHTIHIEECGNPDGKPVIMVHGGPGGGINPTMRRLHDPERYRIILFDQRGCGKSTPHAELNENTTWDLVADMERIREHLGVDKWQVFGGSWGSTLGLAYAQTHPDRVSALILRGIFMIRRFEIEWFYSNGASIIYPDRFEAYQEHIPEEKVRPCHCCQTRPARKRSETTISLSPSPASNAITSKTKASSTRMIISCAMRT
jgi:proline iminopeptidase